MSEFDQPTEKNKAINKALNAQKKVALKLIPQRLFICKAKRIIRLINNNRIKKLARTLKRVSNKFDKYCVENWQD